MTRRTFLYTGVTTLLVVLLVTAFNLNVSTSISADSYVKLFLETDVRPERIITYSRPTSNIEEYERYALLDLNYAVYSYSPLIARKEGGDLPTKQYLYPRAVRKSGWEIGRIFSEEISGEAPFNSSFGTSKYYPQPYLGQAEAIVPDLILHDAELNQARILSDGEEKVWIISDLFVEAEYLWFYYLLESDTSYSVVHNDPTELPGPTKHLLNTNRMFQRRYNLHTLEAQTTELCLPDTALGYPATYLVQSPNMLLTNVEKNNRLTGFLNYHGLCHLETYEFPDTHRLDESQPSWEVPRRLVVD